jgi:hypothetical protein
VGDDREGKGRTGYSRMTKKRWVVSAKKGLARKSWIGPSGQGRAWRDVRDKGLGRMIDYDTIICGESKA